MKKIVAVLLLPVLAGIALAVAGRPPDASVLLHSYYRYLVSQQVGGQAQALWAQLPRQDAAAVQAAVTAWSGERMEIVRRELTAQFGDQGRPQGCAGSDPRPGDGAGVLFGPAADAGRRQADAGPCHRGAGCQKGRSAVHN